MGRFCLLTYTGLTDRFRRASGFLYNLANLFNFIRLEKKQHVDFGNFSYDEEQKHFSQEKCEKFSTNQRKSVEKTKNSASRRH